MAEMSGPKDDLNARQLSIMVRMLSAQDPKTRDMAARALKGLDPEKVTALLRDPALSRDAIVYFTRHAGQRVDWIESLLNNPSLPDEERSVLLSSRDSLTRSGEPAGGEDDSLSLSQRIQAMTVGEKIKLAMKGDKEARNILVKDNNKQVYMAVLGNPGLKESEIEMLARNTGTNTEILRAICRNREWISNRNIMHSVVMNPKTPPEISIRFLPRLSKKDLDFITKSRSLPQALRTNAKRLLLSKAKGR